MTEKLSQILGPEPRKMKVGKSFERKDPRNCNAYHRIRYDFKPHSIDEDREGTLEVRERKEVAVSLPHVDGNGQTNYKGHINAANPKECVLIIDHDTGEITIERLSNQILLKKTRPEKSDSKGMEDKMNPYEVKKVPDKPAFPSRDTHHNKKMPANTRDMDHEPPAQQMSSHKSRASPLPPKPRSQPKAPSSAGGVAAGATAAATTAASSRLESSSSSSSSSGSSDSESDFEEETRPSGMSQSGMGGMPSFSSQDLPYSRGGGVLPTARPTSNKSKKSFGNEPSKARPKTNPISQAQMPSLSNTVPNLDDDLRLSEDSD